MGGAHTSVRVCTCGSQRPVLGVVPQGLSTMVFFWQQWGGIGGGGGKGGKTGFLTGTWGSLVGVRLASWEAPALIPFTHAPVCTIMPDFLGKRWESNS